MIYSFLQELSISWDSGQDMSCESPPSSPMHRPRLRRMNAMPPGFSNSFEYNKVRLHRTGHQYCSLFISDEARVVSV